MRRTLFLLCNILLCLLLTEEVMAQPFPAKNNSLSCTNWLSLPSYQSYAQVGDLDISGNQVTLEAVFIRTTPYTNGYNWAGDLVSKHVDPSDVNYLLRPNNAEITTTNGHFTTPPICEITLNKVYHAAMTYDGSTLKFYRNGFLMSSVPATGNLIQNNHQTRIGLYDANQWNTNLIGYINEVRIWNKVRTQSEIRSYMNSSLPNPATQTGLLAYYTFDNLLNKQGDPLWNASLGGTAALNTTVSNCSLVVDSCGTAPVLAGIVNDYCSVIEFYSCENKLWVDDASAFSPGDTVLLMQMKGATIDSSNNSNFGTITNINDAGNYEFNFVNSISGNMIFLKNKVLRSYLPGYGVVQLIRVPFYQNIKAGNLTCLPWNGKTGGVLVITVADTLEMTGDFDVSGKGFRGGVGYNPGNTTLSCNYNNYVEPYSNHNIAGEKGESMVTLSDLIRLGKGAPACGGGGGLGHNSGGGGGANGGNGGTGGYQLEPCGNAPFDNRGQGGRSFLYTSSANRIFLGSGGGAGQADNAGNPPPFGGNGGGIIIIHSNRLRSNNFKILSNGFSGSACTVPPAADCHDGMGGGGAGGSILLSINQYIGNLTTENKGGKGADMTGSVPLGGRIGAGGGGGGGLLFVKSLSIPSQVINVNSGGANGVLTTDNNNAWGANSGSAGKELVNLLLPFDLTPFKKNIDSVRIKDSMIRCDQFRFDGLSFTNGIPIVSWQWDLGDGNFSNNQQVTHSYLLPNTYIVKLRVIDADGCIDSIQKTVLSSQLTVTIGPGDTICQPNSYNLSANAIGASSYTWSPAIYLNNPAILNPVATPPVTTMFYFTALHSSGCSVTDSVLVTVRSINGFSINPPVNTCLGDTAQLLATGGDLYAWSPSTDLNNAGIPNPLAFPQNNTLYTVQITDTLCGLSRSLSTSLNILPLPQVRSAKSNDIDCSHPQSQLSASGARQYTWSPGNSLDNVNSSSPVATPLFTTTYQVVGTDANGCSNSDSIKVMVSKTNPGAYLMATGFTPNNDGLNDCFGIKYWGTITKLEFSIYNRWGERIFYTTDPAACWDGKVKGVPQDPAVFVYMIRAQTTCTDEIFRKGTFALIR